MKERDRGGFVVEALLAYQLSSFVFSSGPDDGLNAIFFLGPFCLPKERSWLLLLCTCDLSMHGPTSALENVISSMDKYDVTSHVESRCL